MSDASSPVRSAARALLTQGVLPAHTSQQLAPFLPLLLVHLRAALTSPTAAVRLDALEALEALAGRAAQPMLAHHAAEVLGLYVEVLAEVTRAQGAELHVHKTHVKVCCRLLIQHGMHLSSF